MSWTKLHASIVHSSIWSESPSTCKVWVTFLALCDYRGSVAGSRKGLAHLCRVSLEEFDEAIRVLTGPAPDSSDGTTGERLAVVPGGWIVLNHARYRDKQTPGQEAAARRMRAYRDRHSNKDDAEGVTRDDRDVTHRNGQTRSDLISSPLLSSVGSGSSGEGEREREKPRRTKTATVDRPAEVSEQHWNDWQKVRRDKRAGPVTETVMKAMRRESAAAGLTLDDAVRSCAENGWQGFKAAWYENAKGKTGTKSGRPHINDLVKNYNDYTDEERKARWGTEYEQKF